MSKSLLHYIIFPVFIIFQFATCIEREMTTPVEPGSKDCFYQYVKAGETLDIEYQVIDGGHGDLDIRFVDSLTIQEMLIRNTQCSIVASN